MPMGLGRGWGISIHLTVNVRSLVKGRSSTQWGDVVEGVGGEWVGGVFFRWDRGKFLYCNHARYLSIILGT